ncbi:uncharacterized protein LOC107618591 [Arachis ipaensis]|uniref:uncharacterized protein LOC107618591 n=1 Tax=Arachis ipaensis TaxID=130454 RepID=UPI000A2B33EE|nr:uncharacterized protein LOC107618591 [Arachis ipaensis]
MKPKRTKIISDLLISVSKAERQEARLKVRQDSLRLGNVGVIRAGTVLPETWEDGQALYNINHLCTVMLLIAMSNMTWRSILLVLQQRKMWQRTARISLSSLMNHPAVVVPRLPAGLNLPSPDFNSISVRRCQD